MVASASLDVSPAVAFSGIAIGRMERVQRKSRLRVLVEKEVDFMVQSSPR
jgi:hypothetical protein